MRMEVGRHWWLGIIRKADRYLSHEGEKGAKTKSRQWGGGGGGGFYLKWKWRKNIEETNQLFRVFKSRKRHLNQV